MRSLVRTDPGNLVWTEMSEPRLPGPLVAVVRPLVITDHRHSATPNGRQVWQLIAHDGILKDRGMGAGPANLPPAQFENIRI